MSLETAEIFVKQSDDLHIVTLGWNPELVEHLWNRIADRGSIRFSHLMHPRHTPQDWPSHIPKDGIYFFREGTGKWLPAPDRRLLASLERSGVPSIHNMIRGDRVVSKLEYEDALAYATFLARRTFELFARISPSAVLASFDSIHSSLALAVARQMGIPWFALNFSVIPRGLACFCDRMSPAARVPLGTRSRGELVALAEAALGEFERRKIQAHAYIAPSTASFAGQIARFPGRLKAAYRTIRRSRQRHHLRFTEDRSDHSTGAAVSFLYRSAMARRALLHMPTCSAPPAEPYILFGLHLQPESSIDVWAPFFANQMWVIELLARSTPPSHKLLVKIHKSDISNYSREQLERMRAFSGVVLIEPFADTRDFIENADLVISIQGTMGLEAALLGKPVIMLGESPVGVFPSASRIGSLDDLPDLIRKKLEESPPDRRSILEAYASFLAPFMQASFNDWTIRANDAEIAGYVKLFEALKKCLARYQPINFGPVIEQR